MFYKTQQSNIVMAGGDTKLSFSVENILKNHRKSGNDTDCSSSSSARDVQPSRSNQIMRSKLTRRHYSTSSIETVGLGSSYLLSLRGSASSSSAMDSDNYIECRSFDTYTSSPSPLSSPRSVASLPQECLQGDEKAASPHGDHEELDDTTAGNSPGGGQSTDGNNRPKRGRMRFTPEQIQILERRFQEQHYLLPADRKILSLALQLTERQVKTWFQNKRAQYKRTRPLVRHPIYHNIYPTYHHSCPSAVQPLQLATGHCSPSFSLTTPGHLAGLGLAAAAGVNSSVASLRELSLLCSVPPSPLRPTCAVTTPTLPSSPSANALPNYFQLPAANSFSLLCPSHLRSPISTPK